MKRSIGIFKIYIIVCIICILISIIIELYVLRVLFPAVHPLYLPTPYNVIISICNKLLMFGAFPFVIIGIFLFNGGICLGGGSTSYNSLKFKQDQYNRAVERNLNAKISGNTKEIARTEKEVAQAYGALIAERHGTQKNFAAYDKAINSYYSSKITNKSDTAKAIDEANIMREFGKL